MHLNVILNVYNKISIPEIGYKKPKTFQKNFTCKEKLYFKLIILGKYVPTEVNPFVTVLTTHLSFSCSCNDSYLYKKNLCTNKTNF